MQIKWMRKFMTGKFLKIISFATILIVSSCDNNRIKEYKPAKGYDTRGYIDRKIADKKYQIQVKGWADETFEELEGYFHRRAGELCGNTNYKASVNREMTMHIKDGFIRDHYYEPSVALTMPFVTGEVHCG